MADVCRLITMGAHPYFSRSNVANGPDTLRVAPTAPGVRAPLNLVLDVRRRGRHLGLSLGRDHGGRLGLGAGRLLSSGGGRRVPALKGHDDEGQRLHALDGRARGVFIPTKLLSR